MFKHTNFSIFILSTIFVLTIQQFEIYTGNSNHLIHSIKNFDSNKLQFDWIANQSNHLPLFAFFNKIFIFFFSPKIIYFLHFFLLFICIHFIFLICENIYPFLKRQYSKYIWYLFFCIIYHENSFFSGVAGQDVINQGYQPASFGVLFFIAFYLILKKRYFLSIITICLTGSFHPTYLLHTGFFILGLVIYFLSKKNYFLIFKSIILYTVLILPITVFIIFNFLLIDKEIVLIGQQILINRIPHHANIVYWISYKDIFIVFIFFISLFLIKNHKVLFLTYLIFGLFPLIISITQLFYNIQSLGLMFPWRASVIIMPLSSMIIITKIISFIDLKKTSVRVIPLLFMIFTLIFFTYKSYFLKNLNKDIKYNHQLSKRIKDHYDVIERILIPSDLDFIRMNTGLPIFIDWKHHAFKYDEIIEWKRRLDLSDNFYKSMKTIDRISFLKKINNIENISHILLKENQISDLEKNCKNLIIDKIFILIDSKKCYGNL
jgi:hypothetical protein